MTDDHLRAVRKVREEADKLRLACLVAADGATLLHVAYDRDISFGLPIDEQILLGRLQ